MKKCNEINKYLNNIKPKSMQCKLQCIDSNEEKFDLNLKISVYKFPNIVLINQVAIIFKFSNQKKGINISFIYHGTLESYTLIKTPNFDLNFRLPVFYYQESKSLAYIFNQLLNSDKLELTNLFSIYNNNKNQIYTVRLGLLPFNNFILKLQPYQRVKVNNGKIINIDNIDSIEYTICMTSEIRTYIKNFISDYAA